MVRKTPKRSYDNSLREEQAQATRERILEAMAQQLAEDGHAEFSCARVAKRAGVSEPTVYRHFGGREGLFEAFSTWFEKRGGHPGEPESAEQFLENGIDRVFAYFEEHEPYIRAAQTREMAEVVKPGRKKRRQRLSKVLAPMLEHLDAQEGKQVQAILGYLLSARAYLTLKDEFGLSTEEAAAAVNWAMRTLARELQPTTSRRKGRAKP